MSTGKVLLGVLVGVSAGAILGILFAPNKGSVTRKKISKKGKKLKGSVKDKFNEFVENVSEKFENMKDEVAEFSEKVQAKVDKEEINKAPKAT